VIRRLLVLVVSALLAGLVILSFRPQAGQGDPSAALHRPLHKRVRQVHYPILTQVVLAGDSPPPGFTFEAVGRLSATKTSTMPQARWKTPGIVPSLLRRSLRSFLQRAILEEIGLQSRRQPGVRDNNLAWSGSGVTSIDQLRMGRESLSPTVDSNANYLHLPPGASPLEKNVLDVVITGNGGAEVLLRTDQLLKGADGPPYRSEAPSAHAPRVTADFVVAETVDEAADRLVAQSVASIRALENQPDRQAGLDTVDRWVILSPPPGVYVICEGLSTSDPGSAVAAPINPNSYAAHTVKSIDSRIDWMRHAGRSVQGQLNAQAQPNYPKDVTVTIQFPLMTDIVRKIPIWQSGQYRNGAAVIRAREAGLRSAEDQLRRAATKLNRLAALADGGQAG
jgi:hypothetical protein